MVFTVVVLLETAVGNLPHVFSISEFLVFFKGLCSNCYKRIVQSVKPYVYQLPPSPVREHFLPRADPVVLYCICYVNSAFRFGGVRMHSANRIINSFLNPNAPTSQLNMRYRL